MPRSRSELKNTYPIFCGPTNMLRIFLFGLKHAPQNSVVRRTCNESLFGLKHAPQNAMQSLRNLWRQKQTQFIRPNVVALRASRHRRQLCSRSRSVSCFFKMSQIRSQNTSKDLWSEIVLLAHIPALLCRAVKHANCG